MTASAAGSRERSWGTDISRTCVRDFSLGAEVDNSLVQAYSGAMLGMIRKLVPKPLMQAYHWSLARLAAAWYGHPSKRMVVIGVTGTNGKTTVVNLIASVLEEAGHMVGLTSTVNFRIGKSEIVNATKMTMPGRFFLQKTLARMADAGCHYAVIETSSQGIAQFRHIGIEYDLAVFTNLTPEHIEAHGGFENYKRAKLKLFESLMDHKRKHLDWRGDVQKLSVVNLESEHGMDFLKPKSDKKYGYFAKASEEGMQSAPWPIVPVKALDLSVTDHGSDFRVRDTPFHLQLPGRYNVMNAMAAVAVGLSQGVKLETAASALGKIEHVLGRFERIDEGQDFAVIVDYAPEPESLRQLYGVIDGMPHHRIIHVLGSCGGGRDVARRPVLGKLAAEHADHVVVTNEDPYDDDPTEIVNQVADGARKAGKEEGKNLFRILDRREAIEKAIGLAEKGDIVLLTGKGAEQAIVGKGGKKTPWDEREVARSVLRKRLKKV